MRVVRGARARWLGALVLVLGSSFVLGMSPARSDLGAAERPAAPPAPVARPELAAEFLALTNADRAAAGLGPLVPADRLSYATRHSRRMAELGYIFHSGDAQLRGALRGTGWVVAGENVGVGPALEGLQEAFMASAPHRHNILGTAYDRAAIGVVESDGVLWITVVFSGD
jgi:uncharacterized protein YkwD